MGSLKIVDLYDETSQNKLDKFSDNTKSELNIDLNVNKVENDFEWLDIMQNTIVYLDNILRNPNRFIINEEEVVKVELARRITVDSIKHLARHTNYIQEINDDDEVKPSKILNINKDESLDTYENRFIYTLLNNLRNFFEKRTNETSGSSFCQDKNKIQYVANTSVYGEELKISLDLSDITKTIQEHSGEKNNLSYEERIQKAKMQLDGFFGTELMITLSRLHVSPVRSPIRKTNVILKNPNFRKAEELWNYIQSFESKDKKEKEKRDFFDRGVLKNEYDQAFLMAFIANKNFINSSNRATESSVINQMIQRLVDNLLDTDPNITEDKLEEIFNKQIKSIKAKNKEREESIQNIFKDRLTRENNSMNELLEILKEGALEQ